jgi:ATP-dependent RNA circularization protein (DNA/RNA ligase family)
MFIGGKKLIKTKKSESILVPIGTSLFKISEILEEKGISLDLNSEYNLRRVKVFVRLDKNRIPRISVVIRDLSRKMTKRLNPPYEGLCGRP